DGSGTWAAANTGLTNTRVRALAIDPATPSIVYAGTIGGIFKSTDGGGTWHAINAGLTNTNILSLAIDPAIPATLHAGTTNAPESVFKSTDGGGTWSPAGLGYSDINALALDPYTTPTTIYAGRSFAGVYRSADGGTRWKAVLPDVGVSALVIDPSTPGTLYAAASGVFKSTDGAASWVNSGALDGIFVYALAIDPSLPGTLYAGTFDYGVFKSTDGAARWQAVNTGLPGVPGDTRVYALAIDPSTPRRLYAGTFGGGVFSLERTCTRDCNASGKVPIDELITLVNIVLGHAQPAECRDGVLSSAEVDIALIVQAVIGALTECSGG